MSLSTLLSAFHGVAELRLRVLDLLLGDDCTDEAGDADLEVGLLRFRQLPGVSGGGIFLLGILQVRHHDAQFRIVQGVQIQHLDNGIAASYSPMPTAV